MQETWKPVLGYEGSYEISDQGRLRRLTLFTGAKRPEPLVIKPHKKATGYHDYWLWNSGHKRLIKAHRLVWQNFYGPIPAGLCINHKNGVKHDNRLENLELLTLSENTKHGFRVLGRKKPNYPSPGEKNGSAKINEEQVREIRSLYASGGKTYKNIGSIFGLTGECVGYIVRRKTWPHVE